MTNTDTTQLPWGTPVTFKGGTGRNDADRILHGIVNGENMVTNGRVYVSVHIPATNQNVMVAAENLIAEEK